MYLHYKTLGHGLEQVIALHDWFCDSRSYESLYPYLDTQRFTFCFPDLRGYGGSKALQGQCNIEEAAADILALADKLNYQKFHLIGHSMSGMISQYLTCQVPERIQSVIAITPVPASGSPVPDDVMAFLEDGARHNDITALQMIHFMTGQRHTDTFAQYKLKLWRQCSLPEARVAYLHMFCETDFSQKMKGLTTPYLVIIGANDAEAHSEVTLKKNMGSWLKNVDFAILSHCGHYPMLEAPVDLADHIERFLVKNSYSTSQ
jgi:3-oxoadipate enol-lactonase